MMRDMLGVVCMLKYLRIFKVLGILILRVMFLVRGVKFDIIEFLRLDVREVLLFGCLLFWIWYLVIRFFLGILVGLWIIFFCENMDMVDVILLKLCLLGFILVLIYLLLKMWLI